jgi:hypothetical protein
VSPTREILKETLLISPSATESHALVAPEKVYVIGDARAGNVQNPITRMQRTARRYFRAWCDFILHLLFFIFL